ncbi:MAG: ATP-binding protein, partial [Candidatus Aenigmatarchaeota archaeon]
LPAKLTNSQKGTLYSALKNVGNQVDFNELILNLEASEETSTKWTLINILEYVKSLNLFSDNPTLPGELVLGNKLSIINLKGIAPEVQEVVVYKIVSDLFTERKKGNIPPFFMLVEEAHNFAPERSFGETKASAVLRQIASEGRKFGLGMGIVSQRPSRVDKSLLSQASTQFILKVTNPNDLKAISSSVEGITHETEKEIRNIPVGTALVTGIVDVPLFVNIRPRRSKHGGEAVKIFNEEDDYEEDEEEAQVDKFKPGTDFAKEKKRFEEAKGEMILVIPPKLSTKDIELMSEDPVKVKTILVPCVIVSCNQGEDDFNILIDLNLGEILTDTENRKGVSLKGMQLEDISPQQSKVFQMALKLKRFKPAELFAMSGVQFSELYDLVTILTKKGYFLKEGDSYSLNEKFVPLSNLSKFACYEKPDFHRMETDSQLPKKFDLAKIKEFLSKFTDIKDIKECFMAVHEISPKR